MDNISMDYAKRKYTLEKFAEENNLTKQSALNKLTKLKKEGFVKVSGGGAQKRIYTVSNKRLRKPNGFFSVLNKHSPEKINPYFEHYVFGHYTLERAIIDGLKLKQNIRLRKAMYYLFNHVKNWKKLFKLAKRNDLVSEVLKLYYEARKNVKVKRIPKRYEND